MKVEKPVTTPDDRDGTVTTHPAFAQIGASRTSGHAILYGSDFVHNATIRIRIHRSQLRRDLAHDWHHGRDELIEVELSEAQWATFVSSLNVGDGTPCTLRRLEGERMPEISAPVDRREQFAGEVGERLKRATDGLRGLAGRLDEMGLPKKKAKEIQDAISHALMDLESNVKFVAKSFDEHMETTVEKAKQEVHGYIQGVVNRAGIASLAGEPLPLQLEHKEP